MRLSGRKSIAIALTFMVCTGVLSAQPLLAIGSDAEVTNEGLHRVDTRIMEAAWVQPDLDLGRYSKIFFMPATVVFRDIRRRYNARNTNIEEFPISDDNKAYFQETFGKTFHDHIQHVEPFDMSVQVGRDVLMVQGFLLDVVSGVPPAVVGRTGTLIKRPWEATLVLEIRDSMSDTLLARAVNRQRVDGRFDFAEIPRATLLTMRSWSELLGSRLEELLELGGGGWARCELRRVNCEQ